ncbi:MAG: hypothetical protein ACYDBB_06385 [Armatimonadota bacterium]
MTDEAPASTTVPSLEDQRAFVSWQLSQGWKSDDIVAALIRQGVENSAAARIVTEHLPSPPASTSAAPVVFPTRRNSSTPLPAVNDSTPRPIKTKLIIGIVVALVGIFSGSAHILPFYLACGVGIVGGFLVLFALTEGD